MAFLRTALFALVFFLGSVVICVAIALLSPFSKRLVLRGAHVWSAFFVGCARVLLGIRLVVRGAAPQAACIVALKHQSLYETILTLYLFERPAVIMKAELRQIPVWGFVSAQHGSIFVERGKGGAAMKSMLRQGRARKSDGRPVLMFPEGTRVPMGEAPPLKAGLYGLYHGLDVPVVPVALDAGRVWTRGFAKRPGTVTLAFLPDVPAGLAREDIEARVHAAINSDPLTAPVRGNDAPATSLQG